MKTILSKLTALAVVPVAIHVLTSCSTDPSGSSGEGRTVAAYQEGVPGGMIVDTYQITATVTAVDHAKRQATLVTPDGKKTQFTAGPKAINFDQVRVGDQLKVTLAEQLVVYVREKGEARTDGQVGLIALTAKGEKPGGVMAHTVEVTTKVKSVDLNKHKATLEFPDGSTRTVTVRPDVKLSATDVGREVVIQVTEAIALSVEKP